MFGTGDEVIVLGFRTRALFPPQEDRRSLCGSPVAQPQALCVFCLDISDLVASLAGTSSLSSSVLCSICFGAWFPVFILGLLINNNGV